jgi:hypothetical protein
MTPDQLQQIIDQENRMWRLYCSYRNEHGTEARALHAQEWKALRDGESCRRTTMLHHFPVLVECASVLKKWYDAEVGASPMPSLDDVNAALKRLEEIP